MKRCTYFCVPPMITRRRISVDYWRVPAILLGMMPGVRRQRRDFIRAGPLPKMAPVSILFNGRVEAFPDELSQFAN